MVTIPGWVYVAVAGLAVILLAVASVPATAPRARRALCLTSGALGVVLMVLALLLAAST